MFYKKEINNLTNLAEDTNEKISELTEKQNEFSEQITDDLQDIVDTLEYNRDTVYTYIDEAVAEISEKLFEYEHEILLKNLNNSIDSSDKIINKISQKAEADLAFNKRLTDFIKIIIEDYLEENKQLKKEIEDKEYEIESLIAANQALANSIFNTDHIELFVLKTYRDWKYICYNGEAITNFDGIKKVTIDWSKDTPVKIKYE